MEMIHVAYACTVCFYCSTVCSNSEAINPKRLLVLQRGNLFQKWHYNYDATTHSFLALACHGGNHPVRASTSTIRWCRVAMIV